MATSKKTSKTSPAASEKSAPASKPNTKPAAKAAPAPAAKPAKAEAPKTAAAAPSGKKPSQLELIMAAQAKKRAEGKGKAAPSAKSLGMSGGGVHGHMNTNTKGGAVGVARRTAPGA